MFERIRKRVWFGVFLWLGSVVRGGFLCVGRVLCGYNFLWVLRKEYLGFYSNFFRYGYRKRGGVNCKSYYRLNIRKYS